MGTDGSGTVAVLATVPAVNTDVCSGCGRCVAACPVRNIALEVAGFRKHAKIMNPERCSLCGRCLAECPIESISS